MKEFINWKYNKEQTWLNSGLKGKIKFGLFIWFEWQVVLFVAEILVSFCGVTF